MVFRFLRKLLKRSPEESLPDLLGPLGLRPGDELEYYQRRFTVEGVIRLQDGTESRHQYELRDDRGRPATLVAEPDRELVLSLQEPLPPEAEVRVSSATWRGVEYQRSQEGVAESIAVGEVHPGKTGPVESVEMEDDEEMHVIVLETWGPYREARGGSYVFEGELTLLRQDEEVFEVRSPPRVDRKSLNEAHRARVAAEAKAAAIEETAEELSDRIRETDDHASRS